MTWGLGDVSSFDEFQWVYGVSQMAMDMETGFSSWKLNTTDCSLNIAEHLEPEHFDSTFLSMTRNQNVESVEISKITFLAN